MTIINTRISEYGGFVMDLKKSIRIVENFPKPGISFKDITTLISDGEAFKYSIDAIAEHLKDKNVDIILGPEAEGLYLEYQLHMH